MKKLTYSDLCFIEQSLTYYVINEMRIMRQHSNIYTEKDIYDFRKSVQKLLDKIIEIEKEV